MFYRLLGYGLVVWLIIALCYAVFRIASEWDQAILLALTLGFIAGSVLYQIAHRLKHGAWFDPP
jgi:zinc transporter ZupT